MRNRTELHEILCEILGSRHVYFQPPESVKIIYPAIVYSRENYDNDFANNEVYNTKRKYQVTYISKDPDSLIPDKLNRFRYARFSRRFVSENLYHDVFEISF